jgi:hypothetical protein
MHISNKRLLGYQNDEQTPLAPLALPSGRLSTALNNRATAFPVPRFI